MLYKLLHNLNEFKWLIIFYVGCYLALIKSAFVNLYQDDNLIITLPRPKYVSAAIKAQWSGYSANKAVISYIYSNVDTNQITIEYQLIGNKWVVKNRQTTKINKVGMSRVARTKHEDDIDLSRYHNKTDLNLTRVQVKYTDGRVVLFPAGVNFRTTPRETLITDDVERYRVIYYKSFLIAGLNYVRWNLLFRTSIRIGNEFIHYNVEGLSLSKADPSIPRNTVIEAPIDIESMLPEL